MVYHVIETLWKPGKLPDPAISTSHCTRHREQVIFVTPSLLRSSPILARKPIFCTSSCWCTCLRSVAQSCESALMTIINTTIVCPSHNPARIYSSYKPPLWIHILIHCTSSKDCRFVHRHSNPWGCNECLNIDDKLWIDVGEPSEFRLVKVHNEQLVGRRQLRRLVRELAVEVTNICATSLQLKCAGSVNAMRIIKF